ncbi:MAG: hypothetical protein ACRDZM_08965 [Acidimicrobiia bacterium]
MQITPRPFGDVLGWGMTLLGRVWRRLLAPAFWSFTLLGTLTIVTLGISGAGDFLQLLVLDPLAVEGLTDQELVDNLGRLAQAALVAVLLQVLATGFLFMTTHKIVASEIAGAPVATRVAVTWAIRRLPTFIVAGLLASIVVLVGLILLIVPGVWMAGSLTMVSAVVALEETGPIAALSRSHRLVQGRWWQTIGFLLLVALIGSVAGQLVQLVAVPAFASGDVGFGAGLAFVLVMVVQGLTIAAIAVMSTVWYTDLRARKEPGPSA